MFRLKDAEIIAAVAAHQGDPPVGDRGALWPRRAMVQVQATAIPAPDRLPERGARIDRRECDGRTAPALPPEDRRVCRDRHGHGSRRRGGPSRGWLIGADRRRACGTGRSRPGPPRGTRPVPRRNGGVAGSRCGSQPVKRRLWVPAGRTGSIRSVDGIGHKNLIPLERMSAHINRWSKARRPTAFARWWRRVSRQIPRPRGRTPYIAGNPVARTRPVGKRTSFSFIFGGVCG